MEIQPRPLERFRPLLGEEFEAVAAAAERARAQFEGRTIWHVNSTMRGGGVAEMLRALLPYVRGAEVDTRWLVLPGEPEFFALTKRLHNNLHGEPGDGGELGEAERRAYEGALAQGAGQVLPLLGEGDVVFLHDPQTAGLTPAVKEAGATVVWRCHIGADEADETVRRAWDFLLPYLRPADAYVFSRRAYAWDVLDGERTRIMAPSIDPFAPKNQELEPDVVAAILATVGIGADSASASPRFTCADGTECMVERAGEVLQSEPLPAAAPAVVQVSRWDRLKDPAGLLRSFEQHLAGGEEHLVLAGPATGAVADDPEGAAVWAEIAESWHALAAPLRGRVHLASLPMDDLDENAAMVNALQRRADVIVQKSVAEGFGLTVAEGMWKGKPVIGGRVGGIQDQIVDGVSGVLVDPRDLAGVARAIAGLVADPGRAAALGEGARERVREHFLGATRLAEYADLVCEIDAAGAPEPG